MGENRRIYPVLVVDGGGVRAVFALRVLQELEERLGKSVSEIFKMTAFMSGSAIAGSSLVMPHPDGTGRPMCSAEQAIRDFYVDGPIVFPPVRFKTLKQFNGAAHNEKILEGVFNHRFGDLRIEQSLTNLMIGATDIENERTVWIKNILGKKDMSPEQWSKMLLRHALRATTAAPSTFRAARVPTTPDPKNPQHQIFHSLIDGNIILAEAPRSVYNEARRHAPPDAEIVLFHLGTCKPRIRLTADEYNALNVFDLLANSKHGSPVLSLIFNLVAQECLDNLREDIGDKLFDIDAGLDVKSNDPNQPSLAIDDASVQNFQSLEKRALKTVREEQKGEIDRFVSLVEHGSYIESLHNSSRAACDTLCALLAQRSTRNSMANMYKKMLYYSAGHVAERGDDRLRKICMQLRDEHKAELSEFYQGLASIRSGKNPGVAAMQKVATGITEFARTVFRADPPANDDGGTVEIKPSVPPSRPPPAAA